MLDSEQTPCAMAWMASQLEARSLLTEQAAPPRKPAPFVIKRDSCCYRVLRFFQTEPIGWTRFKPVIKAAGNEPSWRVDQALQRLRRAGLLEAIQDPDSPRNYLQLITPKGLAFEMKP